MKLILAVVISSIVSCALVPRADRVGEKYFLTEVKPVLQQHCLRCHDGSMPAPAPNFTSRANAFKPGAGGRPAIVPYHADRSLIIAAVQRGGSHPRMMPRTDISLTDDQIGMLREWIEDGAFWPQGHQGVLCRQRSPENP